MLKMSKKETGNYDFGKFRKLNQTKILNETLKKQIIMNKEKKKQAIKTN